MTFRTSCDDLILMLDHTDGFHVEVVKSDDFEDLYRVSTHMGFLMFIRIMPDRWWIMTSRDKYGNPKATLADCMGETAGELRYMLYVVHVLVRRLLIQCRGKHWNDPLNDREEGKA